MCEFKLCGCQPLQVGGNSLCCQLLDAGADLEMVRDIYGRTTTDMTRKYAKKTPRRLVEALEKPGQVVDLTTCLLR